MLAEDWLKRTQPGYRELSNVERSAVAGFSIVWSVFEARALSTNANATAIVRFVDENAASFGSAEPFGDALAYFRQRYVSDGQTNHKFESLHFRQNDRRELVEAVLLEHEATPTEIVKALLIIVFRLRNNLFHGLKWAYEMRDQQRNFENAIAVLTRVLDSNAA
ncbi:hypothetical protein [Chelativorans intermedius]|uniref:Uncharacterized protein n=1 Tax=Chelativorans intermedius TaxID=515947 RepID=A0ABV6DD01_9HYPH|nr:hypothetical protein [Chelativorans intermedius]MCT9000545.1 hypothetical protein [Chelativorans intermedius]